MEIFNITNIAYLILIAIAVTFSFKSGEKSGSNYMLEYLRHYNFLKKSGYIEFVHHLKQDECEEKK